MVRWALVISIIISLLLTSCGQVGSITGGEKDTIAPRVVTEKVKPPNGSINIYPDKIAIPFDEFIELNKPAENIRVAPADVKLNYTIKGKTLHLNIREGEWKDNTTYTIYLNRAVKDITEGNDSIMSYVFSTGSYIDSLTTAVQIIDAYSGKPANKITVGLYSEQLIDDTSNINPRYFSSTDEKGVAVFQNIKDTIFYLYAFDDENRNNRLDANEKRAVLNKELSLGTTLDSIIPQIRLMPAEFDDFEIVNNDVLPISSWGLGFSKPISDNETIEFLDPLPEEIIWTKEKDSLTAYYKTDEKSGQFRAVLTTLKESDTISKRYFFRKDPKLEVYNNLERGKLSAKDTLTLKLNDILTEIDTDLIKMTAMAFEDTVDKVLEYEMLQYSAVEIAFNFDKTRLKKASLTIAPDAIKSLNNELKDTLKLHFNIQQPRETGKMIIEFDSIPPYGILYITDRSKKVAYEVPFDGISQNTHEISLVEPGTYGFYYLIDEDKDGKWSTGSIFSDKEAEEIIWLNATTTIRANWDVKTNLNLYPTEEVKGGVLNNRKP